jgi:hypothetical protein
MRATNRREVGGQRGAGVAHAALFDDSAIGVVRCQIRIPFVLANAGVEHHALLE